MTRNVSDQAKPCPMCGSKRIYVDEPEYNVLFSMHIYCTDCGLKGFKNFTYKAENPIKQMIDYWNTRAYE